MPKKIIDGKLYDTATAELVAEHEYAGPGDFSHVLEELFITIHGRFFLRYEGGPNTEYRKSVGVNEYAGSEGIRTLEVEDARRFFEEHGDVEDYEKFFGTPEEG